MCSACEDYEGPALDYDPLAGNDWYGYGEVDTDA